ncbi:MAG: hypothetical protein II351_02275, partial [Clostridia bacterium]|nr:hypothetical protein [Clostridia bacterium]
TFPHRFILLTATNICYSTKSQATAWFFLFVGILLSTNLTETVKKQLNQLPISYYNGNQR